MKIEYPCIEEQDFPDRTEFRLVVLDKDPFDKKAKPFETYAGRYKEYGTDKHSLTVFEEYCHIAYKNNNWFQRLFIRGNYHDQKLIIIQYFKDLLEIIKIKKGTPTIRRMIG